MWKKTNTIIVYLNDSCYKKRALQMQYRYQQVEMFKNKMAHFWRRSRVEPDSDTS